MSYPRLLWDNLVIGATLTSSGATAGNPVDNVADWRPYLRWQGTGGAGAHWIKADLGAPTSCSCMGLVGHDLYAQGTTGVVLEGSNNDIAWFVVVAAFVPADDRSVVKCFSPASYRYWRVTITTTVGDPQLGIFFIGNYLEFPSYPESPVDPDQIELKTSNQIAGSGHLLGITVDHIMRKGSYSFQYLTQAWVSGTWIPFVEEHQLTPFIWVWDYSAFPAQSWLMRFTNKIFTSPYSGVWRSLSLEMEGVWEA